MPRKKTIIPEFDYGERRLLGKITHQYEPGVVYERWEFLDFESIIIEAKSEQEAMDRVKKMFGGERK